MFEISGVDMETVGKEPIWDLAMVAQQCEERDLMYGGGNMPNVVMPAVNFNTPIKSLEDLHKRCAHLGNGYCKLMVDHSVLAGLEHLIGSSSKEFKCDKGCPHGKSHSRSVPQAAENPQHRDSPGHHIWTDLVGPMPIPSFNGNLYWAPFKCMASQHCGVYFMKVKSAWVDALDDYLNDLELQEADLGMLHIRMCVLGSDSDSIMLGKRMQEKSRVKGFRQFFSSPYAKVGNVEGYIKIVMQRMIALHHVSGLPLFLWEGSISYVVFCNNRSYTKVHSTEKDRYLCPAARRFPGLVASAKDFFVWGCRAHVFLTKDHADRKKARDVAWSGWAVGWLCDS